MDAAPAVGVKLHGWASRLRPTCSRFPLTMNPPAEDHPVLYTPQDGAFVFAGRYGEGIQRTTPFSGMGLDTQGAPPKCVTPPCGAMRRPRLGSMMSSLSSCARGLCWTD